jgi:CBS domain containing-hemolysin-like protein
VTGLTGWHGLALALFFVLLNGWFVLAEFALVKVRTTRLRELAQEGHGRALLALRITGKLDDYLSAIQLGITLTSLALGWIGEPAVARLIAPWFEGLPAAPAFTHGVATGVAFGTITFLHVVVGEQVPKMMGILRAERFSLWVALPLHVFFVVTWPLIVVLRVASNAFCRVLGFEPSGEGGDPFTEEELRMIVASSHAQGVLNEATRYLLDNVLDYTTRIVREVMTPRRDVFTLDVRAPVADSIAQALDREFSRYLLVDSSKDQVLGFVHVKDLVSIATGRRAVASLKEVARPPVFVPEFVPIDRVRRQLQAKKTHLGVVVDELGDYVGIVTLEDLLEELVGEIQDETDTEQPLVLRQADGTLEVDGGLLLENAVKTLGLQPDTRIDGVDTLGGYVFTLLGRAPHAGDAVTIGKHRLEVLQVDRLRIRRLRVVSTEPEPAPEPAEPPAS